MQVKKSKPRNELEEEKWQNNTSAKLIGRLIIIVSVVLLGLGVGSRYIGRNIQADKTPGESQELKIQKMGQGLKVGHLAFAAWNARWYENSSKNPALNLKPNDSYLLIEITLRNDSNRRRINPLLILKDDRGFYHKPSKKWFTGVGNMYPLGRLNPGVSKDGYIVFDVPKNVHYQLKVSDRHQGNSYALIEIKPE